MVYVRGKYRSTLGITCTAESWLGTAEPGNKPTLKVMRQQPGIRMLDYDLKLQFIVKTKWKVRRLHLTRSSAIFRKGVKSLRESHAEGCWCWEMRFCVSCEKVARVYTRWGMTARSDLGKRKVRCHWPRQFATLMALQTFLQNISIHRPSVVTNLFLSVHGDSGLQLVAHLLHMFGRQFMTPWWKGEETGHRLFPVPFCLS